MAFRASTCGSIPCASLLRDQIQDPATVSALSGGLAAVRAVWRQLSEMDSGLLVVCHIAYLQQPNSVLGSGASMSNYYAAWLEQQPSADAQSKSELTEEGSERSSSCGSIESPFVRSRVLQMARSEDLDSTSSARRWRDDERRVASMERRRRSLHGQKSRFCPSSLEQPSTCREESLQERQRDSRFEIPSDVSLFSIQGPIRTKED